MSRETHRIDLRPDTRGYGPPVMLYNGQSIGKSNAPIYTAARWLLDNKVARPDDIVETWQDGMLAMYGNADELAKWTVTEDDTGLHVRRWKPFPTVRVAPRIDETSALAIGGGVNI
jgi:hypothetical protein